MPRCFLAKKSATSNTHWNSEDSNNNHEDNDTNTNPDAATPHRSTIGSITAAKAVLSIQQPICPPPAHQASMLAASTITKAMAGLKPVEQNNNNNIATQTSWTTGSDSGRKTAARPPRRKKNHHRPPLNLVMPENLSKKANLSSTASNNSEDPAGLTILRTVHSGKPNFIPTIFNRLNFLPKKYFSNIRKKDPLKIKWLNYEQNWRTLCKKNFWQKFNSISLRNSL